MPYRECNLHFALEHIIKYLSSYFCATPKAALRLYDVRGVKVVEEAIEQFAGAAMVARSTLKSEAATATPAARGFMARANGLVTKVVEVLELAEKVKKGSGALIEMADTVRIAIESMPT